MTTGSSWRLWWMRMPDRTFDVVLPNSMPLLLRPVLPLQEWSFLQYLLLFYAESLRPGHSPMWPSKAAGHFLSRQGRTGRRRRGNPSGCLWPCYMRLYPDMIISAPLDETELRTWMYTPSWILRAFYHQIPRGRAFLQIGSNPSGRSGSAPAGWSGRWGGGHSFHRHSGKYGVWSHQGTWKQHIHPAHFDMRFLKPIDRMLLQKIFASFRKIITVEDVPSLRTCTAVIEYMNDNNYNARVIRLGIPDHFIDHGTQEQLYRLCGFDAEALLKP